MGDDTPLPSLHHVGKRFSGGIDPENVSGNGVQWAVFLGKTCLSKKPFFHRVSPAHCERVKSRIALFSNPTISPSHSIIKASSTLLCGLSIAYLRIRFES
jgi:hypothetical protein